MEENQGNDDHWNEEILCCIENINILTDNPIYSVKKYRFLFYILHITL